MVVAGRPGLRQRGVGQFGGGVGARGTGRRQRPSRLRAGSEIAPPGGRGETALGAIDQVRETFPLSHNAFTRVDLDPTAGVADIVDGGQQPVGHRDGVVGALYARQHRHHSFTQGSSHCG